MNHSFMGGFMLRILGFAMLALGFEGFALAATGPCGLPDGTFTGVGKWKNFADQSGDYEATTEVRGELIVSKYNWGGEAREVRLKIAAEQDGSCKLTVLGTDGSAAGEGRCAEAGCSYRLEKDDLRLVEHFMFRDGSLYRVGFKVSPSQGDAGIIDWTEVLK